MKIYARIDAAIEDDINIKRLLIATGLDERTFWIYYHDRLFNVHQLESIKQELNEWELSLR